MTGELPDLNSHLPFRVELGDEEALWRAVDVLLAERTCFAVIGGEGGIRTTERGAQRLQESNV